MGKPKNTKQRDQFNFYKSFDDIALKLNDKQLSSFMRTLLDVQFLRKKYEDVNFKDQLLDLLWNACKFNIEAQVDGYLANKVKNNSLFVGVYDNENGGSDGSCNGGSDEEQEQEQEHMPLILSEELDIEFQLIWKKYTLEFLKLQGRSGGKKQNAFNNYKKLRAKYSNIQIKDLVKNEMKLKIGNKDLERILRIDVIKQFLEDGAVKEEEQIVWM